MEEDAGLDGDGEDADDGGRHAGALGAGGMRDTSGCKGEDANEADAGRSHDDGDHADEDEDDEDEDDEDEDDEDEDDDGNEGDERVSVHSW